jgi:hypothetical protein
MYDIITLMTDREPVRRESDEIKALRSLFTAPDRTGFVKSVSLQVPGFGSGKLAIGVAPNRVGSSSEGTAFTIFAALLGKPLVEGKASQIVTSRAFIDERGKLRIIGGETDPRLPDVAVGEVDLDKDIVKLSQGKLDPFALTLCGLEKVSAENDPFQNLRVEGPADILMAALNAGVYLNHPRSMQDALDRFEVSERRLS